MTSARSESLADLRQQIADLQRENAALRREFDAVRDQLSATDETLGIIASSPADLQAVLDSIVTSAARLCDADSVVIQQLVGEGLVHLAWSGEPWGVSPGFVLPATRNTISGRALFEHRTVQVDDLEVAARAEFADSAVALPGSRIRSMASTPLLGASQPIGILSVRRHTVRPFSDLQLLQLEGFARQAVIAIENARLFQELQDRNRDLTEPLEQQTATGEILRAISRSPTDVQPVLDTIAESAARLCSASDVAVFRVQGDVLPSATGRGPVAELHLGNNHAVPLSRSSAGSLAAVERRLEHLADLAALADTEFPDSQFTAEAGARTVLIVPLIREGEAIGTINVASSEVQLFTSSRSRCCGPSPIRP